MQGFQPAGAGLLQHYYQHLAEPMELGIVQRGRLTGSHAVAGLGQQWMYNKRNLDDAPPQTPTPVVWKILLPNVRSP